MTTGRLEAFSDGCIAIFITITLLAFKTPGGSSYQDLMHIVPSFICYAMSYIVIGIYWGNQHHLINTIHHITDKIIWTNLFWLFALSLVSFATSWVANNNLAPHTVSFYGVILLACNRTYVLLEHMVVEQERVEALERGSECNLDDILGEREKERIAMGLYVVGAIVALWHPIIAFIMYFVVNIIWFVPDRRISKHHEKLK